MDFENPTDANGDGFYQVEVTVENAAGLTDVQMIRLSLSDVEEAELAPLSVSEAPVMIFLQENEWFASDPVELPSNYAEESSSFILDGNDSSFFEFHLPTRQIYMSANPDFETLRIKMVIMYTL